MTLNQVFLFFLQGVNPLFFEKRPKISAAKRLIITRGGAIDKWGGHRIQTPSDGGGGS